MEINQTENITFLLDSNEILFEKERKNVSTIICRVFGKKTEIHFCQCNVLLTKTGTNINKTKNKTGTNCIHLRIETP